MRVAVVTTSYPGHAGDASGHFVAAHADRLGREGHRVTVLAPGPATDIAVPTGGRRIPLGAAQLFDWPGALARLRERPSRARLVPGFALRARRAIAREGPFDRVVAHFIVPSAWPIALGADASLEVHAHGGDVRLLAALPLPLRVWVFDRLLGRDASFVFAASHLVERLAEALPRAIASRLEQSSVVRAPDIVVPDRAALPRPADRPARPYAVWVGRLVPEKRPGLAARAARLAGVPLVVVGDGPAAVPDTALRAGRVDRQVALGWIADAAVLVSTSRDEGAPSAVREARALGVPVIATAAGDVARWAQTDPGITLAHDEDALAEALARVVLGRGLPDR